MAKLIDLTGQIFGRLTVLSRSENFSHGHSGWHCQCTCGRKAILRGCDLSNGKTRSCGCLRIAELKRRNKRIVYGCTYARNRPVTMADFDEMEI